jgi:hypothetical protein
MRFFVEIPPHLVDVLHEQAEQAHRPPRYQAEWMLAQILREQRATATPSANSDSTEPPNSHQPQEAARVSSD